MGKVASETGNGVEGLRRGPRILRVDPEYGDARVPADEPGEVVNPTWLLTTRWTVPPVR